MLAPHARRRFTRAARSSTAAAAGRPSLTVNPPFPPPHYMLFRRVERAPYLAIPGAVTRHVDHSLGMERIEITCTACGGHLGHVFKGEGYRTPSGFPSRLSLRWRDIDQSFLIADERHCVNSISLSFAPGDKEGGGS